MLGLENTAYEPIILDRNCHGLIIFCIDGEKAVRLFKVKSLQCAQWQD